MDIDEEISKTEEKIEKLKILKAKQDELKKLQADVAVTDDIAVETKPSKEKKTRIVKPRLSSRTRKVVASLVAICLVATLFIFVPRVVAADPTIVTASPGNGTFFASTNNASGVNWAINITDTDGDIANVELWSNSSGSWVKFYNSGALGVTYHNTSGQNGNWTGSWTKYWWNISVNDGGWHNNIYSFTTGYQWGNPQMAALDDVVTYDNAVVLKNDTGDYYLFYENGDIDVKTSDTGTNWSLEPKSADVSSGLSLSSCFIYNNQPYCLFQTSTYLYYATWDGASWNTGSTTILQDFTVYHSYGGDCVYYNGLWNMVSGVRVGGNCAIQHCTGTFPASWTVIESIELNVDGQYVIGSDRYAHFYPSMAILNGTLHLVYKNMGSDMDWETYDGVTWTDRGGPAGDTLNLGGGTSSSYQYHGCSMVKDPVTQQLVTVYVDSSGDLRYRVTDNLTGWSKSDLIFSKGAYDIRYPYVDYIDHRLVISFSYNLRGNYNIYTISAPDYSGRISGLNYTLNRIQWPDVNPDDTYVNSTIFNLRNINNRSIKTITWHFEDIGEITCASNIEVWTNMSGAWTSIGTCDASGDVSTLDISGLIPGNGEWISGNYTWWKVEILAVGSTSEDLHSTDEDFYYKITF